MKAYHRSQPESRSVFFWRRSLYETKTISGLSPGIFCALCLIFEQDHVVVEHFDLFKLLHFVGNSIWSKRLIWGSFAKSQHFIRVKVFYWSKLGTY
jgi:hypothetical protein